ncbi:MAG: HDOD domain-containing protein [Terriglobia bacterium]|jgi:EAL and modified HD-GYP domain-containing signal transduction protein
MPRFITRQPVLDRYERVYGYQLLSRPGEEGIWPPLADGHARNSAPASTQAWEGFEEIIDGTRAFIPCTRQALISGQAATLPRDRVVLEVLAGGEPDEEVVAVCRGLKDAGFLIALDNFQGGWEEPLADVADIIQMDVTASSDRAQWLIIRKYRPRGTVFVAKNVDTRTQFQAALQQGYAYFQGQFYTRSQPYSTGEVAPVKLVYLLVLAAVTRPEINVQEVADTIKHDLALSYKLLRFLNSARFAFHSQIKSIRHALLLLGQNEIRKWIGLISVAALGEGGPPILVNMALIRAAFCESLAPLLGERKRQPDYFFLGLLSCIDVLMRRPMRVMLAELPIAADVGAALVGEQNPLHDVLRAVISYEQGNWEESSQLAKKLALKDETLCQEYLQAIRWSRELVKEEKEEPAPVTSS